MNSCWGLRIGRDDVIYSVKIFVAAMAALWIAFALGLSKPYWALATVYIISQPLAGTMTSRALGRMGGTIAGSLMVLVLIPNLVNSPALLCFAMAGWLGGCLFVSLLFRSSWSYCLVLAGYTISIIGFPCVNNPDYAFDIAVQRVQEITIGVLCVTIINVVVFPKNVAPVLTERIEGWMHDAGQWAIDALGGRADDEQARANAHRMATGSVGLATLAAFLPYDAGTLKRTREQLNILERQMNALLPLLTAVGDRVNALRQSPGLLPISFIRRGKRHDSTPLLVQTPGGLASPMRSLLADLSIWIAAGRKGDPREAIGLRRTVARLTKTAKQRTDWNGLLEFNLCERLRELVNTWENCLVLRRAIAEGRSDIPAHLAAAYNADGPVLHRDASSAWFASLAAMVGLLVCCGFGICTGWSDAGNAASLGTPLCCLFASQSNPVRGMKAFVCCSWIGMFCAGCFHLLVLPSLDGFVPLALALAPFLLTCGLFMTKPGIGFPASAVAGNTCLFMAIESPLNFDAASFINTNLATVTACTLAVVTVGLFQSICVEERATRLFHGICADIARLAGRRNKADADAFVHRTVDRVGLLASQLGVLPASSRLLAADVVADMRVGMNVVDIQRERGAFSAREEKIANLLLADLERHFQRKITHTACRIDVPRLKNIDSAMARLLNPRRTAAGTVLLHALVGLRRCLYPTARQFNLALIRRRRLVSCGAK